MKILRLGLGVFGIAVTAGVLMFGVLGFGSASAAPGPNPGGPGRGKALGEMQAALAAKLGISVDTLKAAETAARNQLIQDAVGAGKITQAQADALKNGQRPQGAPGQAPGQGGPGQRGSILRNIQGLRDILKDYETVLAQKLGKTPQQLQTAKMEARDQLLADAVKAGKLTQAQADAIKSGKRPNFGNRGPGNGTQGQGGAPRLMVQGVRDAMAAAASALNMKPEDLQAQLRSGKSLAEIAQAKGVDRAALRAGIMAAVQNDVNAALRDGKITATQATSIINEVSKNLDQLLDRKMGQRNGPGNNRPGGNNFAPGGQPGPSNGQPQFNRPRGA